MKAEEEARFVEGARQEANENAHKQWGHGKTAQRGGQRRAAETDRWGQKVYMDDDPLMERTQKVRESDEATLKATDGGAKGGGGKG